MMFAIVGSILDELGAPQLLLLPVLALAIAEATVELTLLVIFIGAILW